MMVVSNFEKVDNAKVTKDAKFKEDLDLDSLDAVEIDLDKVKNINGMDITIVTSAKTDEEAKALLEAFGFPFKKN